MDTTAKALTTIICISGPFFFATTVALGIVLYFQFKNNQLQVAKKHSLDLKIQELENRIIVLSNNAVADFHLSWCKEIASANYSSEIEVEIKFVYFLMRFLGYGIADLKTRVPVEVPVGRQKVVGIADWVVYNHQQDRPFLIIEVKEPNQQLNNSVQDQARSYAFALNTPFYMLTNGKKIEVFERRIDNDIRVLASNVKDLHHQWQTIKQVIGKGQTILTDNTVK